jgi:TonB family protein
MPVLYNSPDEIKKDVPSFRICDMMREIVAAISMTLAAACAVAQSPQAAPSASAATTSPDADLTIHYKAPGVTAPELLPMSETFNPIDDCNKLDGDVNLLVAVDQTGAAQIESSLGPVNADLLRMATEVLERDSFKPGTVDGAPAIVAVEDHMKLEACRIAKTDPQGQEHYTLRLRSRPEQTFDFVKKPDFVAMTALRALAKDLRTWNGETVEQLGEGVKAPEVVHRAELEPLRRGDPSGIVLVDLIVDANGMPQNVHLVRSLGGHPNQIALNAVRKYRFKPAMKAGVPVAVWITVELNFRAN